MPYLTLTLAVFAGLCLYAGFHFLFYFKQNKHNLRLNIKYLHFSLACLLVSSLIGSEILLYASDSPEEYTNIFKWRIGLASAVCAAMSWFIYSYSGYGKVRVPWFFTGYFAAMVFIPNVTSTHGGFFDALPTLVSYAMPWGEKMTMHDSPMTLVAKSFWLGAFSVFAYGFVASWKLFKIRRLESLGLGVSLLILLTFSLENFLVISGVIDFIFLAQFGFPAMILILGLAMHKSEYERFHKYQSALDHVPAIVYMKAADGNYLYINKEYEKVFNVSNESMLGRNDYDLFEESQANIFRKNDLEVLSAKKASEYIEEVTQRDGKIHTYQSIKFPIFDKVSQFNPIALCGISTDITEQLEVHNKIAQNEQKYHTLFEAAGDAIVIIKDGIFVDCNTATTKMFGCSREQFIGKSPNDFSPETQYEGRDSRTVALERIRKAQSGEAQKFRWRHMKANGEHFDAEVSLNLFTIDGDQCLQGIIRDVTERLRAETIIKNIAAGVSAQVGEEFFNQSVTYLTKFFGTKYAFIGLIDEHDNQLINTLAVSVNGSISENISYRLEGTPCADVIGHSTCTHQSGVQESFPKDILLQQMGVDSYVGTPLFDSQGNPLGLIVLLDDKPLQQVEWIREILQIFAARAGAELERVRSEKIIQKQSEQLRASIEAMPGVFYMYDEDGYLVLYNEGYKKIFNLSDEDMQNLHGMDVAHPDDRQFFQDKMADVLLKGETASLEIRALVDKKKGADSPVINLLATGSRMILDGKPYLVGAAVDITDRVVAQEDLFMKERAMEATAEGIVITDAANDNQVVYANRSMEIITGYSQDELLGRNMRFLQGKDTDPTAVNKLREAINNGEPCQVELVNYRKSGASFWSEVTITPVKDKSGEITHYVGTQQDVTDKRITEEALRRSQKMEAVGQLAGGVAHDFNNQLGVIIGYLDFLEAHVKDDKMAGEWIYLATQSAKRCMSLTRRLLALSSHKFRASAAVNLNDVLVNMQPLIAKALTPAIQFNLISQRNLWNVAVEPGELQDCILNLAINARDAMPNGGYFTIETHNITCNAQTARDYPELEPGEYVYLLLSDTGQGMDKETQERVFEPFFTTKPEGKGTGLGLAMVYGFVNRYGGYIKLISEPDIGTTICIYLPRVKRKIVQSSSKEFKSREMPRGNETILVVDDEEQLLHLAKKYLSDLGYEVLTATNAAEALKVVKERQDIDLLFSDVIMPGGVNGYELAQRAHEVRPQLKVLLTSGFAANEFATADQLKYRKNVLQKPYNKEELASQIRLNLDSKSDISEVAMQTNPQNKLAGQRILVIDDDVNIQVLLNVILKKLDCEVLVASSGEEGIATYENQLQKNQAINVVIVDLNIPGGMSGGAIAQNILKIDPNAKIIVSSGDSSSSEMRNYKDYGFSAAMEKEFNRKYIQETLEKVLESNQEQVVS